MSPPSATVFTFLAHSCSSLHFSSSGVSWLGQLGKRSAPFMILYHSWVYKKIAVAGSSCKSVAPMPAIRLLARASSLLSLYSFNSLNSVSLLAKKRFSSNCSHVCPNSFQPLVSSPPSSSFILSAPFVDASGLSGLLCLAFLCGTMNMSSYKALEGRGASSTSTGFALGCNSAAASFRSPSAAGTHDSSSPPTIPRSWASCEATLVFILGKCV
mmetsp:Transcript_55693/g.129694  ORF Transcript_55693/g.129694 Transcript_55693/m.129694 type:complete len:213 (+) Transcript_55693:453-1091(+)